MEVKRSFYTTVNHEFDVQAVEEVSCNLCKGTEYSVLDTEHGFEIRECASCGLVYVSPQPTAEELPRFYEGMYAGAEVDSGPGPVLGAVEKHLSNIVTRRVPEGAQYLEVGCGGGRFLESMSRLPLEITGIEMSERAIEQARRRVPEASILNAGIDDAPFEPESFDCVALIAVLEHLKDPQSAIAEIIRWLRPGGLVLIQVPYVTPYIRLKKWLPNLPIHFEAPRHLFDFSPKVLDRYLAEAGFEDIKVEIARPYASNSRLGAYLIWAVKWVGLVLYHLSGRRYIYPLASAITVHGRKPERGTDGGGL